ncbi:MAG TPA: methyltransferase domain-containing protein [Verrucomicrobiota bacterium]|nr:methyltransferase domain-containing protein [Verrucomicrobiota bacterium]
MLRPFERMKLVPDSASEIEVSGRAWRFVQAFVREPLKVGAIWPSSGHLSEAIVAACHFAPGDTVVELGPGTGNFTKRLLHRLGPDGRLVALELSETNVNVLRRRFPRSEIIFDSAEYLGKYVPARSVRCVISGLAWSNMLPAHQSRILNALEAALAPGGEFVGFAYKHARYFPTTICFRRLLRQRFATLETLPTIWRNLPPAYVFRCRKLG